MINAAENPCKALPRSNIGTARLPLGDNPTRSEPAIARYNSILKIFTRPTLSANPPITTMKIPEKSAVSYTAMFIVSASTPSASIIAGDTIIIELAKSQKVNTARIKPISTLSVPLYVVVSIDF